MPLFDVPKAKVSLVVDATPFVFYEVDEGYAFFTQELAASDFEVGPRIPLSGFFTLSWILSDGEKVGYLFSSVFQTVNHGGFLLTYMNNGIGKANSVEVLLKTDQLVIYNYPNKGTLAISPTISEQVRSILEEQ